MSNSFDAQVLYLITIGRNTGLPREIEIWFVESTGRLYILAEHGHQANWVRNILNNPSVTIKIGARQWSGTARVLDPEKDSRLYREAQDRSRQKYGWGEGLPVEIELESRPLSPRVHPP